MADTIPISPAGFSASERRASPRHILESISYVELGKLNGGVILNLCEGGLALRAAIPVMDNNIPPVRFHLPQVREWIEVQSRVTWKADENRTVGVAFVDLPEGARLQIQAWIAGQEMPAGSAPVIEEPPAPRIAEKLRIPTSLYAPMQSRIPDRPRAPVVTMPSQGGASSGVGMVMQMPSQTLASTNGAGPANGAGMASATNGMKSVGSLATPAAASSAAAAHPGVQVVKDAPVAAASAGALRAPAVGTGVLTPAEKRAATIIPPVHAQQQRSPWILVPMVVILSVAFVLAGWAVGRGGFGALRDTLSGTISSTPPGNQLDPSATPAPDAASQIEIADSDGRTRTIPWDGPVEAPAAPKNSQSARRQGAASVNSRVGSAAASAAGARSESRTAQQRHDVSQIWSQPKQPAGSATELSSESQNPPDVDVNGGSASGSLPSAVNSARIQPSVAPVASPRTATGTTARPLLPLGGPVIKRVEPIYPQYAIDSQIEGVVELQAFIATDGHVSDVHVIDGPKQLVAAAVTAVKQWQFEPAVADGKLVESRQNIRLTFTLNNK
jgi:TonB family protein